MCADPIGEIERLGDQLGRAAQAIAVPAEFQRARIKIGVGVGAASVHDPCRFQTGRQTTSAS